MMNLKNIIITLGLITFLSCSKDDDSTPTAPKTHVGTWNLNTISFENSSGTIDGKNATKINFSYDHEDVVLNIKEDGSYTSSGDFDWDIELEISSNGSTETSGSGDYDLDYFGDGAWTRTGNNLNFTKALSNPITIASESDTELKLNATWRDTADVFGDKIIWTGNLVYTFKK